MYSVRRRRYRTAAALWLLLALCMAILGQGEDAGTLTVLPSSAIGVATEERVASPQPEHSRSTPFSSTARGTTKDVLKKYLPHMQKFSATSGASNDAESWLAMDMAAGNERWKATSSATPVSGVAAAWVSQHYTAMPYWESMEDQRSFIRALFPSQHAVSFINKTEGPLDNVDELQDPDALPTRRPSDNATDDDILPFLHMVYLRQPNSTLQGLHQNAPSVLPLLEDMRRARSATDAQSSQSVASPVEFLYNGAMEKWHPKSFRAKQIFVSTMRQVLRGSDEVQKPVMEGTANSIVESIFQLSNHSSSSIAYLTEENLLNGELKFIGRGTIVIEIPVPKDRSLAVVTQIKDHRWDTNVPRNNCVGYSLDVDVRSAKPVEHTKSTSFVPRTPESNNHSSEGELHLDDDAEADDDDDNAGDVVSESFVWNVFANLFDNSMICEILPSVPLRVDASQKAEVYYLVVRSMTRPSHVAPPFHVIDGEDADEEFAPNPLYPQCQLQVFVSLKKESVARRMRHTFAFLVPVLLLTLPTPFLVRYSEQIREALLNTDFIDFLWCPAIYIQAQIIALAATLWWSLKTAIRRLRRRDSNPVVIESQEMSPTPAAEDSSGNAEPVIPPMPEGWSGFDALAARTTTVPISGWGDAGMPREAVEGAASGSTEEEHNKFSVSSLKRESEEEPAKAKASAEARDDEEEKICRICRDGEETEALVAPCECTGTVRWIHRSCLDRWRMESVNRNQNNVTHCEICRKPFTIHIKRSTVLAERYHVFMNNLFLLVVCLLFGVVVMELVYEGIGALSCFATYHSVSRSSKFTVDGVVVTMVYYAGVMMMLLFAYGVVHSWFRHRTDVVAYMEDMQVLPPFWTSRNVVLMSIVTLVLALQILSMGYLFKYGLFLTSNLPWTWEASPFIGGILFSFYISSCMNLQMFLNEHYARQRALHENNTEGSVNPTALQLVTGAVGNLLSGSRGPTPNSGLSATAVPASNYHEGDEEFTQHFEVPPDQRVIRAYEYSPPTRVRLHTQV